MSLSIFFLNRIGRRETMAMALFTSSLLMQLFGQEQTFLGQFCVRERGNYTNSSTYQANLESLLSSFSNTTADYGADLTPDTCRDCISNSSHDLRRLCPNYKEAIIYYQTCMFRYSDRSIFGTGEISPRFVGTTPGNFPNVTEAIPVLQKLLRDLRNQAASDGPLRKYATGEATLQGRVLYVLVQCTPDSQELQCKDCLDEYIGLIQTNNLTGKGGGADIVGPSCNIS
ncbi:hypothetical protein AAG906_010021 [Vitis piasezkii]